MGGGHAYSVEEATNSRGSRNHQADCCSRFLVTVAVFSLSAAAAVSCCPPPAGRPRAAPARTFSPASLPSLVAGDVAENVVPGRILHEVQDIGNRSLC